MRCRNCNAEKRQESKGSWIYRCENGHEEFSFKEEPSVKCTQCQFGNRAFLTGRSDRFFKCYECGCTYSTVDDWMIYDTDFNPPATRSDKVSKVLIPQLIEGKLYVPKNWPSLRAIDQMFQNETGVVFKHVHQGLAEPYMGVYPCPVCSVEIRSQGELSTYHMLRNHLMEHWYSRD